MNDLFPVRLRLFPNNLDFLFNVWRHSRPKQRLSRSYPFLKKTLENADNLAVGWVGRENATSGLCCPPLMILIENFPALILDPRLSLVDQQTLILRIFYDLETSFVLTVERGRRDRDAEIETLREREF